MKALPFPTTALSRLAMAVALTLGGASSVQAQSLVDLYQAAVAYDSALQSARAQHQASISKAEQAKAGLRPQASLAGSVNWANTESSLSDSSQSSDTQSIALAASQPLYRPVNSYTLEQAQLSIDVAKAQLDVAEQDLMVRTAQAYFDVVAAQDALAVVQAQKTAVAEQLALAKRSFEVGTATVTDSREAQASFDLVVAQEIAAANDLQVKKLALDQLVGRTGVSPRTLTTPVVLPELLPANPDAWVQDALRQHPTVRQTDKAFEIAEIEVQKAQAGHLPTLDLVGQYQIARSPSTSNPTAGNVRNNTASVGLQFNLPLYAGGSVQNRVKEALALVEKSRADRETALRSITQATRSAYFGVLSGLSSVKALEAAEASSQSALDANRLGYQVGVRINIDVLNSQSQLFKTKGDLAEARYNVLIGILRLKQASGVLKAEDLQPINALLR
jgi:outer membrane protein